MHPLLMPLLLLSVALTACKGEAPEPGDSSELDDRDGDGALSDVDCDDDDAAVSPGAVEACDGIDNNCDGLIDDEDPAVDASGGVAVLVDGDGDGFGAEGGEVMRCVVPSGYATVEGDCDDGDDAVNPDAEEVCDERDNNCDGLVDDEDPALNPRGGVISYPDADGDGFGVGDDWIQRCVLPSGYVSVRGDCDDGDATVNPSALEICANGVDDDCSGDATGCGIYGALSPDEANVTITGESESYLGREMQSGDINGDGYDDLVLSAGYWNGGRGRAYILYGPITADLNLHSEYDAIFDDDYLGSGTGNHVTTGGDLDGDGFDEIAISSEGYGFGKGIPEEAGLIGLQYGSASRLSGNTEVGQLDATFGGESAFDYLGIDVEFIGDVNGDGYDDLAASAVTDIHSSSWIPDTGSVYIIPGSATRLAGLSDISSVAKLTINGSEKNDHVFTSTPSPSILMVTVSTRSW